jgi:hypothetical protein
MKNVKQKCYSNYLTYSNYAIIVSNPTKSCTDEFNNWFRVLFNLVYNSVNLLKHYSNVFVTVRHMCATTTVSD